LSAVEVNDEVKTFVVWHEYPEVTLPAIPRELLYCHAAIRCSVQNGQT